jgi:hypothetical protein
MAARFPDLVKRFEPKGSSACALMQDFVTPTLDHDRDGYDLRGMSCRCASNAAGICVSCRVVSCRVVSCRVVSCRVVSCRVVSCLVVSCRVVSCRVVSCRVVSCRAVPCRVVLSC